MKIKNLLSVFFALAISASTYSQSNLLNSKNPDEIGKKTAAQLISDNDKPLPYGYVHDRDVLMGKTIWEFIDLDERINFPLYYPIDTVKVGKERRSLFQVLLNGIKAGKINEVYVDDYFNTKKTIKDIESSFQFTDTIQEGINEFNNYYDDYKSGRKVLDKQFI
jgi:gliding motility associated protien GldN